MSKNLFTKTWSILLTLVCSSDVILVVGSEKSIVLIISDNGKGFEVSAKKNGIGLKNLKERIEEISGVFTVESEIEKGTKITIEISKNGK
mgnify:CR=1 FL=1